MPHSTQRCQLPGETLDTLFAPTKACTQMESGFGVFVAPKLPLSAAEPLTRMAEIEVVGGLCEIEGRFWHVLMAFQLLRG